MWSFLTRLPSAPFLSVLGLTASCNDNVCLCAPWAPVVFTSPAFASASGHSSCLFPRKPPLLSSQFMVWGYRAYSQIPNSECLPQAWTLSLRNCFRDGEVTQSRCKGTGLRTFSGPTSTWMSVVGPLGQLSQWMSLSRGTFSCERTHSAIQRNRKGAVKYKRARNSASLIKT